MSVSKVPDDFEYLHNINDSINPLLLQLLTIIKSLNEQNIELNSKLDNILTRLNTLEDTFKNINSENLNSLQSLISSINIRNTDHIFNRLFNANIRTHNAIKFIPNDNLYKSNINSTD